MLRYSFAASVELTDVHSETHFTEQTSNLSLFGCHVDSEKLLPAGTRVRVRIVRLGELRSSGQSGLCVLKRWHRSGIHRH